MEIMTHEGIKALHAGEPRKADRSEVTHNPSQATTVPDQLDKGIVPWWGDLIVNFWGGKEKN